MGIGINIDLKPPRRRSVSTGLRLISLEIIGEAESTRKTLCAGPA
jgi:hypothetical protein